MRRAVVLLLLTTACAHGRVDDPPLGMELKVSGLKEDERALLEEQLCALPNVSACERRSHKNETTLRFTYRGSLGELRGRIAQFPHPGLTPEEATAQLRYGGFDNLAPTLVPLGPDPKQVLTKKSARFRVEVPDADVAEVRFADKKGKRDGAVFEATVPLEEGDNRVLAVARDEAGNERELALSVRVDTTPPVLEVRVEQQEGDAVLVAGKVESGAVLEVDGRPLAVDLFGNWQVEVRPDPDKRTVEVVARDEHGNEVRQRRALKDGRVLD